MVHAEIFLLFGVNWCEGLKTILIDSCIRKKWEELISPDIWNAKKIIVHSLFFRFFVCLVCIKFISWKRLDSFCFMLNNNNFSFFTNALLCHPTSFKIISKGSVQNLFLEHYLKPSWQQTWMNSTIFFFHAHEVMIVIMYLTGIMTILLARLVPDEKKEILSF